MEALFNERGLLVATDYYESEGFKAGRPGCIMREGIWHLMLPERSPSLPDRRDGYAMPWKAKDARGWQWKIGIGRDWSVLVPLSCFEVPAPELPEHGEVYSNLLRIYGFWLPGLSLRPPVTLGVATDSGPEVLFSGSLRIARITAELKGKILRRELSRDAIRNYYQPK